MPTPNEFPVFQGRIGVARRDITPPVGIYNRNWGAALSDVAMGIHRPMLATAIAFFGANDAKPLLLIGIDLGGFGVATYDAPMRQPILQALGLDSPRLLITVSHTHSGPSVSPDEYQKPGGHLIKAYVESLDRALLEAAKEAVASAVPAMLTWRYGKCDLAVNRDMRDPADPKRILCGYNPDAPADDTVLVGRATRSDDHRNLATIVNYACHPTTLAWDNNKISPDYIGGMRDVVEPATGGAPVLFMLGACGELSPAEQYSGDTGLADRHGNRLGHAVVSTLCGMTPPGTALRFVRPVESGARLGLWGTGPAPTQTDVEARIFDVPLALKPRPSIEEVEAQLARTTDRPIAERLSRKIKMFRFLGNTSSQVMPVWSWRIGPALFFAQPNEPYSLYQQALRQIFRGNPVLTGNLVNGGCGYLVPQEVSDPDLYQYWQSAFENEGFKTLTQRSIAAGQELLKK